MPRKSFADRCKTTHRGQKARAKKFGVEIDYTADDLLEMVPSHCLWCRRKLTPSTINFDHLTPVARGGEWTLDNLAVICGSCNRRKGPLNTTEYGKLLAFLYTLSQELGDDYAARNILARLAAGGAWIHS